MIKNYRLLEGFTLIELLVVITIIMTITASWTLYFFGFLDSQKLKSNIEVFTSNIKTLDLKVKNYEIFDYEINFLSGSLWYIYYINKFDIPYSQTIEFDSISWTWIIETDVLSSGWIRSLKVYKKHKVFLERVLDAMDTYTWSFIEASSYKIVWTLSWEVLNEIWIKYFTENNVLKENEDYLELSKIYKENKSTECNNILKVTNIWWKKQIYCWEIEAVNKINKAYLFFIQNNIEKFIEIN